MAKITISMATVPAFKSNDFIKRDTDFEKNSEYRTDIILNTDMDLDRIHFQINQFLLKSVPKPLQLHDPEGHNEAFLFCKLLKQLDLNDVRTNTNKIGSNFEKDGTRQDLIPVTDIGVFLWAVSKIAYREYVPQRECSQSMLLVDSYILDVIIGVKVVKKKYL